MLIKIFHGYRKTGYSLAICSYLIRVSEITAISLSPVKFSTNKVSFSLLNPQKSQHVGPSFSLRFLKQTEKKICSLDCLKHYLDLSSSERSLSNN